MEYRPRGVADQRRNVRMRPLRLEEYWERTRKRMIAETEQFLRRALNEPHLGPVIPSFPTGQGRFPPAVAEAFWQRVLFESQP